MKKRIYEGWGVPHIFDIAYSGENQGYNDTTIERLRGS